MAGPITITNRLKIKNPLQDEAADHILMRNAETKEVSSFPKDEVFADFFNAKEDKNKKGVALGYVPLNEFTKVALQYLNVVNNLVDGGSDFLLTAEQGKQVQLQVSAIQSILFSDNVNLDTVQEIVDALENVQSYIDTILVNDLTTGGTTKALSAEMGKTLKTAIDNIYQPDVLISAVAPTRSVNTFTYPAGQYTYLISKTLRTLIANYVVTIDVTASTTLKRVDLIQGRSDGTFSKKIGAENAIIAIRPEPDANCVPISFINVFGNTIENPTPITKELSIQDYSGVEKFRITDYLRFKGVSFDPSAKALVTDPLMPLAAFLDIVNGNDSIASIGNSTKSFKTMTALIDALPVHTGETFTIYIDGGIVPITRRMPTRNLTFVANKATTLDFTDCMEDNGTTNATAVLKNVSGGGVRTWTFNGANISIISNYVGQKYFGINSEYSLIKVLGTIDSFNWKSVSDVAYRGFVIQSGSNFTINNLYDSPQNTYVFLTDSNLVEIYIKIYNVQYGRNIANKGKTTIDKIVKVGTGTFQLNLNTTLYVKLGDVYLDGCVLVTGAQEILFNGTVFGTCVIDLVGVPLITGVLKSTTYCINQYLWGNVTFRNFSGKLNNFLVGGMGQVTFENCNIEVNTNLLHRYTFESSREDIVIFKGANTLKQNITTGDLFTSQNGTGKIRIELQGFLKSNVTTYGKVVEYFETASTFKEKLNERVIRSKVDLINHILSSNTTYIIDGTITLLSGEYIEVPSGGLTISGYGFDVSKITKSVVGQSIFSSPVGGSGNFVTNNMEYNSGLGSVFNLVDSDGSHAIELNDINFQSCASLGTLNHYRQFTATTCGIYGCSDGFTLEGAWNGFKLVNTNAFGFGAGGTLVKKGLTTSFANRLYLDLNLSLPTGAKICDFDASNFASDKLLQVVNCLVKVNGVIDPTTTTSTFPNISPFSPKAYFTNNIGIKNSFNEPYGLKTTNMTTYANDADAATGGIQIREVYLETSTGYFKTRLS